MYYRVKSVKNSGQFRGVSGSWLVVERHNPRGDWGLITDFDSRAKAVEFVRYKRVPALFPNPLTGRTD